MNYTNDTTCSPREQVIRNVLQLIRKQELPPDAEVPAESLLAAGTLRIKEVAAECGYNSAYHFTNEFRRIYGVSPSQYRMDHTGLNHSGEKTEEV